MTNPPIMAYIYKPTTYDQIINPGPNGGAIMVTLMKPDDQGPMDEK